MDSNPYQPDGDASIPPVKPPESPWQRFRAYHTAPLQREYTASEGPDSASASWLEPGFLLRLLIFAALSAYFVAQASVYWLAVIDDSYITFRFVDMFVKGYGWRFSPEGPRVEGFTNFLWAAALIPPHYLGWDLMYVSKVYGLLCGILTMAASWGLARAIRGRDDYFNLLAPAFLATNAHFAHWSMMGLETLLQCALITGAYYRFEMERRDTRRWLLSPLYCVLAAMTRIDSLYYLSPLGLYGLWLVLLCRLPIKRMLLWGLIAAVPFTVYWTWRWNYFGDMLPNTYYAKQRFVSVEGHDRGALQLQIFYLKQGNFNSPIPAPLDQIDEKADNATALRTARIAWSAFFGGYNSFLWINLWLSAALLCGCAMLIRFAIPRGDPAWRALEAEVQFGKIGCLVLLPWLLNLYYVYHVNGDWMPCFRFFQIVLGFIAVAVAVGFGSLAQVLAVVFRHPVARFAALAAAALVPVYLLAGVAYEQGRIMSVYIFGKDGIYWAGRQAGWYKPAQVRKAYSLGFSPPLEYVSNYLLLNTQDDAWIFMSDIGQPLWFSEHLNLYDVDGLTDPFLAHAPSTRGNLPTLEQHRQAVRTEWNIEKPNREQRKRIDDEARRRDFDAFLGRNARYIMDQRRPEYLLLFINHVSPDPKSDGGAYPQISWRVWKHGNMKDYVEDWTVSKIGNAYNHVFRRADVPKEVPDDVKLKRLYRAIERNPRILSLVILLEREARMMKALPPADEERIRSIIIRTIERFPDDPGTRQLVNSSLYSKDSKLVQKALAISLEHDPDSISGYFILADAYEKEGNLAKAEETVRKAIPLAPPDDNSVLYRLIWLNEQLNRPDKVREYARQAIKRRPKDDRPWSDLASSLERLSNRAGIPPEEALSLRREALIDYRKMAEIRGETPDYLRDAIERLERQIQLATPPQPTPLPQPTQPPQPIIDPALQIPLNAPVETDYQP